MKNKLRIGLWGNRYHVDLLMKQLNNCDENVHARICEIDGGNFYSKLREVDIYHGIGTGFNWKKYPAAKLMGKKTICHWIGSDVLTLLEDKKSSMKVRLLNRLIDVHLAGSETLVEELQSINIKAKWIPLVPQIGIVDIPPFPKKFTVVSYIPDSRPEFCGASTFYKLAHEFPNVNFLIVSGSGEKQRKLPNVTYLGWQKDMGEIYRRSTVFLRFPEHDGLSLSVLEALVYGRQVIWNNRFSYCHYGRTYDEVKKTLLKIKNNPILNYEGAKYIRGEFNVKKILSRLVAMYKTI